ncbi:bifunctional DNA primase/polymerase [Actinomadura geliboluensis]|uniref:bifunctional DNA primase/polymerase n=1 Tax=Actinomadura geliboluensis TaxID=882440 RepID=UPI003717E026
MEYVTRWRWPVMVGAQAPPDCQPDYQPDCRPDAGVGLGVVGGVLEPTLDPERVREWWTCWPYAGIVAVAGEAFDVVTLPVQAGRAVLESLTERGAWLGPVMSDDDTIGLLVRPGQSRSWASLLEGGGAGFAHVGAEQLVVLPPGSADVGHSVRWVVPPTSANAVRLPAFDDLGRVVSEQAAGPARRMWWSR